MSIEYPNLIMYVACLQVPEVQSLHAQLTTLATSMDNIVRGVDRKETLVVYGIVHG